MHKDTEYSESLASGSCIGLDANSHITFSLSLCLRAWWSCVKVQHQMAGWQQLWTNKEEHHPATRPLEFRHLQKSKYTVSQMGHIHEQWWWIEKVSSKLSSVWNRLCGWCPSYGRGHRGSCPKSQSYQVNFFFYCFVFCHGALFKHCLLQITLYIQWPFGIFTGHSTDSVEDLWPCPLGPDEPVFSFWCISTRETTYGRMWSFTSDESRGDTAYTQIALDRHTDTSYFQEPCG